MSRVASIREKKMAADAVTSPSLTIQTMDVSPELADAWLSSNKNNRRRSKATVKAYARDMAAGKWLLSGDAIRFDEEGRLVDGQHRLAACVEAGVIFRTLVIGGLPGNVMRVLDHGRPRTIADNLTMEGRGNSIILAASARWLYIFKHGSSAIGKGRVTATEILETVDKHPLLERSCAITYGCLGVTASLLGATHYVASSLLEQPEEADNFAAVFVSSHNFYEDDAALAWRERLIRNKQSGQRILPDFMQRGTIHAWNNFRHQIPAKTARAPDVVGFMDLDYKRL
jgi:hypothetical protein